MYRIGSKIIIYLIIGFFISCIGINRVYAAASDITPDTVLYAVNETRVEHGLQPLTMNAQLQQAAEAKGVNMQSYGYWAHTNPTTHETGWTFIQASGYHYLRAGENLAKDYENVSDVMNGWLHSPAHTSIMLSGTYTETGVAVIVYTLHGTQKALIVQLFAKPVADISTSHASFVLVFQQVLQSIVKYVS